MAESDATVSSGGRFDAGAGRRGTRIDPDDGFEEAFDELFPRAVRLRRRPPAVAPAAAEEFEDGLALRMARNGALLTLAPRQHQAVALRYLGGLSDRESPWPSASRWAA